MITRPHRATVGNPRCAPVYSSAGTQIVPEYQEFLDSLGITYRQWNHWQAMGWVSKEPWHKIINEEALSQRAFDLSEAARLKVMSRPVLADYLAEVRQAHDTL